jgi:CheY-like chemotaxis protein
VPTYVNRVRILVVDDDEGIRIVIPKMLASLGVTVLTASSFSEAVKIMAEVPPPDFIFLDLGLPDTPSKVNTLQHLPDLKAFNPAAPVVVLTGDPDEKLEQIAKTVGADAYRRKMDLTSQLDLWLSMKEAIEVQTSHGLTPTEALTKILNAIAEKMSNTAQAA